MNPEAFSRIAFLSFAFGLSFSIAWSQSSLAILAAAWIWWRFRGDGPSWNWTAVKTPLLLFVLTAILGTLAGREFGFHGQDLAKAAGIPLILPLSATLARGRPSWAGQALRFFAAGAGLHAFYALALWGLDAFHQGKFSVRAGGAFGMALTYAEVTGLALLAAAGAGLKREEPRAWKVLAPSALIAFLLSFSRGPIIALGAGLLALVLAQRPRWFLPALGAGALLFSAWLGAGSLVPQGRANAFWRKILNPLSQESFSSRARVDLWRSGLVMIRDRPLGLGPGNVYEALPQYRVEDPGPWGPKWAQSRYGHLHNDLLQTAAERGIAGALAYAWLVLAGLVLLFREARGSSPLSAGAWAAWVFFLFCGLTEYTLGDSEVAMVFWFLGGLGLALAPKKTRMGEFSQLEAP